MQGWLDAPDGRERVVLKRVKSRVDGAIEMGGMEHLLNVYASRTAKNSIARFMGYSMVGSHESKQALTEGLWLMWKFEGAKTLAHFIRKRDCVEQLAYALDVPYECAVPIVMQHVFECVAGLHDAGLVHRDVKPLNIIFAEEEQKFKLIDLGACADLRTGTNYKPDESILDSTYCPPEQYCMPTDSPHIDGKMKPFQLAISPLLWSKNKPDRFDSFSCGLVLMQLAVPKLRTISALKSFNQQFRKSGYNLQTWKKRQALPESETAILDHDDGLGWSLAGALLRPRGIQVDESGGVSFVNTGGAIRLPVKAALQHAFVTKAQERVQTSRTGSSLKRRESTGLRRMLSAERSRSGSSKKLSGGSQETQGFFGNALNFWSSARDKLKALESQLSNQEDAVISQTGKVQVLTEKVVKGQATEKDLKRQQTLLAKMTNRLNSLQQEFGSTASNAQKALGFLQPTQNLSNQVVAVTRKQQLIEQMRGQKNVKQGELARQEKLLGKMQVRLGSLEKEVNTRVGAAEKIFSLFGSRQSTKAAAVAPAPQQSAPSGLWSIFGKDRHTSESDAVQSSGSGSKSTRSGSSKGTAQANVARESSSTQQRGFSFFGRQKEEPAWTDSEAAQARAFEAAQAKKAGQSNGNTMTNAAVTGLYAGLKLTGFALRVATDLATSVTKEAERNRIRSTALKAEKRKHKEDISQFLALMNECQPPITSQSRWKEVSRRCSKDARFVALSESVRVSIFNQYLNELAGTEKEAEEAGLQLFKAIVNDIPLSRTDELDSVEEQISADPRFEGIPEGLDLELAFAEALQERQPEFEFMDLLAECTNPVVTHTTSWPQARKQILSDIRFETILESDRRRLFRDYLASLQNMEEEEEDIQTPSHTQPSGETGGLISAATDMIEASKESLMNLTALRAEQARLRAEYEKMEAKLQAMERRMRDESKDEDTEVKALNGKTSLSGFWGRRD